MTRQPLPLSDDIKKALSVAQLPCEMEPSQQLIYALRSKSLLPWSLATLLTTVAAVVVLSPYGSPVDSSIAAPLGALLVTAGAALALIAGSILVKLSAPVAANPLLRDQLDEVIELVPPIQDLYGRALADKRQVCGLDVHFGQQVVQRVIRDAEGA